MEAENFKARFSVRIVGRLELKVLNANLAEESGEDSQQVREADVPISDHTLALVEFSKMSGIQSLVPVNSINREVLFRLEDRLLCQLIKHLR